MCTGITTVTVPQSSLCSRRRIAIVVAIVSVMLLLTLLATVSSDRQGFNVKSLISSAIKDALPSPHRKLLNSPKRVDKPDRFWGDTNKCTDADLVFNQGPGAPLPSGIPTYTVEIANTCISGCDITEIHFRCKWFSSARLINPQIFMRLHYDDCLVNGGQPLRNGESITFQYANTYSYPLSVKSMTCL